MLNPSPDAIIFDFDGVVIDSRPPVRAAVSAALAEHGYPPRSDAELDRTIGPPATMAFAELTGQPESSTAVAACVESYHRAYARVYLDQTELVGGIAEVLNALAQPLALATAKETQFVEPLLERLEISERFEVVSSARDGERKTAILNRAIAALGARAAVLIGDRSFDVEAAHATGSRAVGVTWGIGGEEELSGADVIVGRPSELMEVLPCR